MVQLPFLAQESPALSVLQGRVAHMGLLILAVAAVECQLLVQAALALSQEAYLVVGELPQTV